MENYYERAQTLMYDYHPSRELLWNRHGNQELRMDERNEWQDKKEYNL